MKQFDERDTMFARKALKPGTKSYEDYYKRYPEKKAVDDNLRELSKKLKSHPIVDPLKDHLVDASFSFLADINHLSEGNISEKKQSTQPEKNH